MRSTTRPTDGKSIAISSAKHSCAIKVPLTIGVDLRLVKATSQCYRATRIVPATKDCPMCGEAMRLRTHDTVVRIPGNPSATAHTTREWVCPDCDYFEEADEEE
jgi:rubredoxin